MIFEIKRQTKTQFERTFELFSDDIENELMPKNKLFICISKRKPIFRFIDIHISFIGIGFEEQIVKMNFYEMLYYIHNRIHRKLCDSHVMNIWEINEFP